MRQWVCQAAIQTKGLELQPDEAEAVVVEEDEQAWRALRTGEAVSRYEACPVKTTGKTKIQISYDKSLLNKLSDIMSVRMKVLKGRASPHSAGPGILLVACNHTKRQDKGLTLSSSSSGPGGP